MRFIAMYEDDFMGMYKTKKQARKAIDESILNCFSSGDLYAIYERVSVVKAKVVVENQNAIN